MTHRGRSKERRLPSDSDSDTDRGYESEEDETEIKTKERLIKNIELYNAQFEKELRDFNRVNNKKKKNVKYTKDTPLETIQADLNEMRTHVASKNAAKDMGGVSMAAALLIQQIGETFGFKLAGPCVSLAGVVQKNKEAYDIALRELMCKYSMGNVMEPEWRLVLLTGQSMLGVHFMNKAKMEEDSKANFTGRKSYEPQQPVSEVPTPDSTSTTSHGGGSNGSKVESSSH